MREFNEETSNIFHLKNINKYTDCIFEDKPIINKNILNAGIDHKFKYGFLLIFRRKRVNIRIH